MALRKSKNKKLSKEKAWKYFSAWVRRSNANHNGLVQCFTCHRFHHWKEVDAGHFMSRRYEATLFDEKNVQAQCVSCNKYHSGRQYRFGQLLNKIYGKNTAEKLERKSKMYCNRNQDDYERIAQKYYDKFKEL